MLSYNLRFSLRHLQREKLNTTLHLVGLTLGMSVCLLIGLFLRYEFQFEHDNKNADRIYRVNSVWTESTRQFDVYATSEKLSEVIRREMTGVDKVTLARAEYKSLVEVAPQRIFKQEHILIVEPEFLDIFQVELIRGNKSAFKAPYQALLNETTAKKYFGSEDAVGKTFKYRDKFMMTVAGVFKDLPHDTHLPASMLLSYVSSDPFMDNGDTWNFSDFPWSRLSVSTYIVAGENFDLQNLNDQLGSVANKNINSAPTLGKNIRGGFELQGLTDIHFDTKRFGGGPWVSAMNVSWLWFYAGIGLVVLLLACINFLNLTTAQAISRSKEVGIRKAIGAQKTQLLGQFLSEAFVITLCSGVLAVVISKLLIPYLNSLLGKQITFSPFQSWELLAELLFFIVLTSILAGFYPAWLVSKFKPVVVLKSGTSGAKGGGQLLRKSLVVLQFTISSGLLVAVLLLAQQADFLHNSDLGFDKENIVRIEIGNHDRMQVFANDLLRIPGIKDVSFSRTPPISDDHWWNSIKKVTSDENKSVCAIYADSRFFSVYDLSLVSGIIPKQLEAVSGDTATKGGTKQVVVNEKLLKELDMGTPQEAIGKHFLWDGDTEISGVVADFNNEPLNYTISAAVIYQDKKVYSHANVKLEANADIRKTLAMIEATWKRHFSDGVFEYTFVDKQVDAYYSSESTLYSLFRLFAGIAVLISYLGLWGLVVYASRQRVKEVGIRRVMGASVAEILVLLTKDFLVLVLMAFMIAAPVTYFCMQNWLNNFAFHISIGWMPFAVAASTLISVALLTISVQMVKAASTNPVKSLRTE